MISQMAPTVGRIRLQTHTLTIAGANAKLNHYQYRCNATEKPGKVVSLFWKNDPTDAKYPLFLALAFELRKAQEAKLIPPPYQSDAEKRLADKAIEKAKADAVTVYDVKLSETIAAQGQGYEVNELPQVAKSPRHHAYSVYKDPPPSPDATTVQFPDESLLKAGYPLLRWIVANGWHIRFSLRSFDSILYSVAKEDQHFGYLILSRKNVTAAERGRVCDRS